MEDNEILKNYIKEYRYSECISLLKNKIVSYLINKIRTIDETINYTTISDLISLCDVYLNDSTIACNLKLALNEETELEQIEMLLYICEENNIR